MGVKLQGLKKLREDALLTGQDVATKAKISLVTYRTAENGLTVSYSTAKRIARVFGKDARELKAPDEKPQSDVESHDVGEAAECRYCHFHIITDDWVYSCPSCGTESCPDCAGKCGCAADSQEAP